MNPVLSRTRNTAQAPALLEIKNLKAGYVGSVIVNDVSFSARAGEIVAIVGPNGAGKSTLLKSVFNLVDVYSGDIWFGSESVFGLQPFELIHRKINFVPQGRAVFENLSVIENLEMGAVLENDAKLRKNHVRRLFAQFPILSEKQNQSAVFLSGGQRQLLALARALMSEFALLLVDEPSLGLDPKTMHEIFSNLQKIAAHGTTILLVEQNAKQAIQIADRTVVLEDGRIALEGGPEIIRDERIKHIYLGGR